jgi:hypothetical protein
MKYVVMIYFMPSLRWKNGRFRMAPGPLREGGDPILVRASGKIVKEKENWWRRRELNPRPKNVSPK